MGTVAEIAEVVAVGAKEIGTVAEVVVVVVVVGVKAIVAGSDAHSVCSCLATCASTITTGTGRNNIVL